MPLTEYLTERLLDHVFRGVVYTPPTTVYLGLFAVAPTSGDPDGTELAGGAYHRVEVTWAPADGRAIRNLALVPPEPAADVGPFVAVGFWDAAAAGNLLAWARTPATTIPALEPTYWPAGSLAVVL